MIVSDRWRFLIATPTKTGNHSLRGLAEAWASAGGDPVQLRYYRPVVANRAVGFQHQMSVPVGKEHYDRWIMVRDPYARMVSCFEFMRHHPTEWGHWVTLGGFEAFCEWFLRERKALGTAFPTARVISAQSPYKFVESYRTLHGLLSGRIPQAAQHWGQRPAGRLRLEAITTQLGRVATVANRRYHDEYGIPPEHPWRFGPIPHRNAAQPQDRWPGMTRWQDYWVGSDRLRELGELLCAPDAAWLASPLPEPAAGLRTG